MLPLNIEKYIGDTLKKTGDITKLGLSPIYGETVKLAKKIKIHSDINEKPTEILSRKFPNETDEELKYRTDNFEPVTPSYWNKALGVVNRVWNKQNYSIDWKDVEEGAYFLTEYPVYGSLEVFFKSIVTNQKVNDPNSVLVVMPYKVPVKEDAEGNETVDQSESVEPFCYIYGSKDVLYYDEMQCLVLSEEKSEVKTINSTEKTGLVLYLIDEEKISRIYQVGKKEDWTFVLEEHYTHNLGYIPVWKLKGTPAYHENNLLYHSYFLGAVPLLNKAVSMDTTLDVAISKFTYPNRAYYYEPCNEVNCENGKIPYYEGDAKLYKNCNKCNGTGQLTRFSPFADYKIRISDSNLDAQQNIPYPEILEPPTNNMAWTKETIYEYIYAAFTFLNIDVSNSDPKGSETALGKKIDREELMSFLLLFSTEIFNLLKEVISAIGMMRYKAFTEPVISSPTEFSIKNAYDLTEEYANAQEKGLPNYYVIGLSNELVKQRFGQDEYTQKVNHIINLSDAYFTFSNDDIIARKGAGIIDTWQVILHDSVMQYIQTKLIEDANFLEKPEMEIVTALKEMAKADAALLPSAQKASTENILGALKVV